MPNDRWDHLLDADDIPMDCEVCGDRGIIDMTLNGDSFMLLAYCTCAIGEEYQKLKFLKESDTIYIL